MSQHRRKGLRPGVAAPHGAKEFDLQKSVAGPATFNIPATPRTTVGACNLCKLFPIEESPSLPIDYANAGSLNVAVQFIRSDQQPVADITARGCSNLSVTSFSRANATWS